MKLCIRVMRFLFPKAEKKRMEYRFCLSYVAAHLEDIMLEMKKLKGDKNVWYR